VLHVESQLTFRRNILPPSSGSRNKPRNNPVRKQVASRAFTLVSWSAYSSTLKMERIFSSETSVDFQRTTRRYIPEDSTLQNHPCENLKSYTILTVVRREPVTMTESNYLYIGYKYSNVTPVSKLTLFWLYDHNSLLSGGKIFLSVTMSRPA
jgi:hypothetical protein